MLQYAAEYQRALWNIMEATETVNRHSNDDDDNAKWNDSNSIIMKDAEKQISRKEWKRNKEWFDQECKLIFEKKNTTRTTEQSRDISHHQEEFE